MQTVAIATHVFAGILDGQSPQCRACHCPILDAIALDQFACDLLGIWQCLGLMESA